MHKTDLHPVEALILIGFLTLEATITLLAAAWALVMAFHRPVLAKPSAQPIPEPPPAIHPLQALVVEPLEAQTVSQLRAVARQAGLPRPLVRKGRKSELVAALSVARA